MGTRVGVGTGAPLHELHVVGQTYIDGRLVLRGSHGVNDTGFTMLPRDEKSMHFLYPEFSRWSLEWDPTAGMTAVQNEALQALNQTMYLMHVAAETVFVSFGARAMNVQGLNHCFIYSLSRCV